MFAYLHWVIEWRLKIYRECLTQIIAFKTKNTRLYCLFFVYVSFGDEKKDENTANADLMVSLIK